jgi:hypothetical protein
MIEVNYLVVLVCAVLSMVIGSVWYGPLFGKKWMEIVGATLMDVEARKEMQKGVVKLYVTQFLLTLFQVYVLIYFTKGLIGFSSLGASLWIWAGFIIPTVAGSSMWNNDSSKISWARFLIQSGYQLVLFVVFGIIIGYFA